MAETQIHQWIITKPYLELKCALGEAPFYEEAFHSLRFVDIIKKKIHTVDLNIGPTSLRTFDFDDSVSVTANIEGSEEDLIVGAKLGYAILNRNTGHLEYLKKVWDEAEPGKEQRMRFNDGAVDSSGRFWAGAMNDFNVKEPTDEGVLFRLDSDLKLHRIIQGVTVPNGIGWSIDNQTMYFIDSPTKKILQMQYNSVTGQLSDQRIFFRWKEEGDPDGLAVDVQGCLWVAIFGGWKVIRLSSEGDEGKIIGEITLPTRLISCPAFVGEELFITSAAEEEPEKYPQSVKYAGDLFQLHVGVAGLPVHKFRRN